MKPATLLMILSAAIFALTVATRGPAQTEIAPSGIVDRIDHYATGFPLEGGHERVACESCHRAAVFKGTPRTCANCHNNVLAEGKGFRHIPTAAPCATCHSVQEWRLSRFDHTDVIVGCVRCHNNFTAPGKTATHPPTGNVCEDCHRTVHWNLLLREVGAREPPRLRRAG